MKNHNLVRQTSSKKNILHKIPEFELLSVTIMINLIEIT